MISLFIYSRENISHSVKNEIQNWPFDVYMIPLHFLSITELSNKLRRSFFQDIRSAVYDTYVCVCVCSIPARRGHSHKYISHYKSRYTGWQFPIDITITRTWDPWSRRQRSLTIRSNWSTERNTNPCSRWKARSLLRCGRPTDGAVRVFGSPRHTSYNSVTLRR